MEEDSMLFSLATLGDPKEDGYSASSVTLAFGLFSENTETQALFARNKVGKPIAVMAEGTYYLKRTTPDGQVKYRAVTFTADDIRRIAETQPRDVPFNYDHRKASGRDGVKGWLRFGEGLSHVGELRTKTGPKVALFATPELGEEALSLVADGIYRDVSVEYREADKVLTGCALTSYPVMRNLQFGEVDVADDTEDERVDPEQIELSEVPEGEDPMDLSTLTPEKRKELAQSLLAELGIDVAQIVKMGEDLEQAKKDAEAARHETLVTKAESDVRAALGTDFYGMTDELATSAVDVLVWADENTQLNFGEEDGGAPDVKSLVSSLLGVIAKNGRQIKLLGGETAGLDEDGNQEFGNLEDDEADLAVHDPKRVKSLVDLARSLL